VPRLGVDRVGGAPGGASRRRGVYLAVVTGRDHRSHRVRLRFPWLPDGDESGLARVLAPMAGGGRGAVFLPGVGDQVLVVFERGDVGRPIVVGGMWSAAQPPPESNRGGQNDVKTIRSTQGHEIVFDDTPGRARLVVVDARRATRIELDSSRGVTTISSQGDIVIKARGAVRFHGKAVVMTATGGLAASAGSRLEVGGGGFAIGASGALSLGAASINLNGGGPPSSVPLGAVDDAVATASRARGIGDRDKE
jgi:uncharacterized protein involved in type VI secretion and phage assembly